MASPWSASEAKCQHQCRRCVRTYNDDDGLDPLASGLLNVARDGSAGSRYTVLGMRPCLAAQWHIHGALHAVEGIVGNPTALNVGEPLVTNP
jgi:hypothetical protein